MTDSRRLQKTPCYNCLVRSMCSGRKIIVCGELASYLCPTYVTLRARVLRIRRILPRVDYIKDPDGEWIQVPTDLYTEETKEMLYNNTQKYMRNTIT